MSEYNTQKGPVISVAVRPRNEGDREKFLRALSVIGQEDPAIRIETAPDDVPTILSGMSEEHLEATCDRLLREFRLQLDIGVPTVIYLETVHRSAEGEGKYIRQTGGAGNYGHVKIRVEPNEPGKGFEFVNDIKGGVMPREYIEPIEQGIREALQGGVLAGYEIVDVKATLFDGSYHDVDSNEMAFKIAGSMAFKEAARKATPVLLEPVMSVEVVVPGGVHGSHHRRSELPPRADRRYGAPCGIAGNQSLSAPCGNARIWEGTVLPFGPICQI